MPQLIECTSRTVGSAQDIGWLRRFDGTTAGTRARVGTPANGWARMSSEALPVEEALSRAEQRASPLYAGRVEVYAKAITGHFRTIKWAALVVLLGDLLLTPGCAGTAARARRTRRCSPTWRRPALFLRHRDLAAGGLLPDRHPDHGRVRPVPGDRAVRPAVVRLRLPADGMDRPVHAGRALDRGRPRRADPLRQGAVDRRPNGASGSPSTRPGC